MDVGYFDPLATEVFKKLEHEGFIYALSNKSRKKAANAPLKHIVAKTKESKRKMDVGYFDLLARCHGARHRPIRGLYWEHGNVLRTIGNIGMYLGHRSMDDYWQ